MTQFIRRSYVREAALAAIAAMASFAALAGGATPAQAQAPSARYYEAQLAAPLAAARSEIIGGVAWRCAGDSCVAAKGTSRPEVVCGRLARKVGAVSSFSAAGATLEVGRLAKCNRDEAPAVLTRNEDEAASRP